MGNELKMEVWISDFDRNLNVILVRLNLIDSPENREILRRNGLSDVDISRERDTLYSLLKTQDSNQNDTKPSREEQMAEQARLWNLRSDNGSANILQVDKVHVHSTRNNTKDIDALLGLDPQICLVLKHHQSH